MDEISNIIQDLSIASLENRINIAAVALVSDSGNILFQTENFNLKGKTEFIFEVLKGKETFSIDNFHYNVSEITEDGILATNTQGLGQIVITPYNGGAIVVFALPNADFSKILEFLNPFKKRLNELP